MHHLPNVVGDNFAVDLLFEFVGEIQESSTASLVVAFYALEAMHLRAGGDFYLSK